LIIFSLHDMTGIVLEGDIVHLAANQVHKLCHESTSLLEAAAGIDCRSCFKARI
jgi:hypothetical protein